MKHIRIVLCRTSHPGNIGAAARAMKNMGLNRLYLVTPARFPHEEATSRASGAADILHEAVVCDSLKEAIADCEVVYATSARQRSLPWPLMSARDATDKVIAANKETAIVFGNERVGLTNDELMLANFHVNIPTVDEYSSLNLAQAVQVLVYELFMSSKHENTEIAPQEREMITNGQLHGLIDHFEKMLYQTEFIDPNHPKLLMKRLTRVLMRANLDPTEMNILRGMISSIERKINPGV